MYWNWGDTHNIVTLDTVDLAPSVHDPSVVRGDDGDNVDALALDLLDLLDVGGQVASLAAGRESACPVLIMLHFFQGRRIHIPGTENRTTFFPFHSLLASYSWGLPQTVGSSSVIGAHLKKYQDQHVKLSESVVVVEAEPHLHSNCSSCCETRGSLSYGFRTQT